MLKANLDIRQSANLKGVKLWQIADKYGVNDVNFTKKLRKELPDAEKNKIFSIIDEIAENQKGA